MTPCPARPADTTQAPMLKKLILIIAIFAILLLALSVGEVAFGQVFHWISGITGVLIQNFSDLFAAAARYLHVHTGKVLLAALLTVPISLWILRSQRESLGRPTSQRRIAIVLAIFLGWLGAHRFFLGQIGWGLGFLLMSWIFVPLAVVIGWIDAIRYLFMDDETFARTQLS
ncbi:TM2 domain-containing protein [Castellaniella caeni]|uniref:TM2 domain-containing protein n=1 Tax=Castellaniella caeni TaxID=266123 RepID=UPI001E558BAC|nr:TM2 domain-containing protein [Castellaniella caeni]